MVSRARKPRRREPAPKAVRARTGEDYRSRAVWVLALALVVGPDSALEKLFRAVDQRMGEFSYAISLP